MSIALTRPAPATRLSLRSPPLENGDCLTAPEFLRRYEAMPHVKKAELINGVVYMGSPVRYLQHGQPDGLVQLWLSHYAVNTPGVEAVPNTTAQLDLDNVPQPDAMLRIHEDCGGQSRVDERDYLAGAPELVVEIAASTASIDLRDKLRAYRRNGVREYVVWRTQDQALDWFVLHEGEYRPLAPAPKGVLHSSVFPGLWLAVEPLLALDGAAVLATLQAGLKSAEHRAFVARLAAARRRGQRRQS